MFAYFRRATISLVMIMMVPTLLYLILIRIVPATSTVPTLPVLWELILILTTLLALRPMQFWVLTEFLDAPEVLVTMFLSTPSLAHTRMEQISSLPVLVAPTAGPVSHPKYTRCTILTLRRGAVDCCSLSHCCSWNSLHSCCWQRWFGRSVLRLVGRRWYWRHCCWIY